MQCIPKKVGNYKYQTLPTIVSIPVLRETSGNCLETRRSRLWDETQQLWDSHKTPWMLQRRPWDCHIVALHCCMCHATAAQLCVRLRTKKKGIMYKPQNSIIHNADHVHFKIMYLILSLSAVELRQKSHSLPIFWRGSWVTQWHSLCI